MDLNIILNWAIPSGIVLIFIGIFYSKLKEPIDSVFGVIGNGIRSIISRGKEASESVVVEDIITYA